MGLIKMPYELKTDSLKLKIMLYGKPGIGKSTLALSMPHPLLIDADNGVDRIQAEYRVPTVQVGAFQEVLDVLASDEIKPFETIVFDTAGKLLDYINDYIVKANPKNGKAGGTLSQQGWGVRAVTFGALVKSVSVMGKHLVFVAHETEERDGDTKYTRPYFGGGKAGNDLIRELDAMGYMQAFGNDRTVCFAPSETCYAKNCARLDDVIKIPVLRDGAPNNFMTGLVAKFEEVMNGESERIKEFHALMADITAKVEAVTDAAGANALAGELGGMPHLWDSLIKTRKMFGARVKHLGLTYDEAAKTYTDGKAAEIAGEMDADVLMPRPAPKEPVILDAVPLNAADKTREQAAGFPGSEPSPAEMAAGILTLTV